MNCALTENQIVLRDMLRRFARIAFATSATAGDISGRSFSQWTGV